MSHSDGNSIHRKNRSQSTVKLLCMINELCVCFVYSVYLSAKISRVKCANNFEAERFEFCAQNFLTNKNIVRRDGHIFHWMESTD